MSWGCLGDHRVFNSILGLYVLAASSKLLSSFKNQKKLPDIVPCPLGEWVVGEEGEQNTFS